MTALISASALRKTYSQGGERAVQTVALDDVDVTVNEGEMLAIVGPSGSGKSTLLHCLSGIASPDAGTITLGNITLTGLDDDARSQLRATRFGFVFQGLNLLPALSVIENVELATLLGGGTGKQAREASMSALEQVGLADRAHAGVHELSGGEQQRVAVARAVAHGPSVIWADEPTGSLDSASGEVVIGLLRDAVADGRSVVVVTHSDQVAAAADRVVRLADGRVA